ncbi:MAG: metallophosphoesterase [Pseudoflavonifractor sp.]|nr:metallophosphoesterase [Pseudoflavonifractor sp.]
MTLHKNILAGVLAGTLAVGALPTALAATVHYNDSSVTGGDAQWQAWVSGWESLSGDYTQVSLTPGRNETELNFAWYSKAEPGKAATPVIHFGTDKAAFASFSGVSADVDTSLTGGTAYVYNHVTVTGLKENTDYFYTVEKNGIQTEVRTYRSGSFSSVKMLYVGDPQIGASKGQPQNGEKLLADAGAANTAARNDAFAWARTLSVAAAQNPDVNFIISAGDQVNKTGKPKEEEYAGYLSAPVLQSLPVATTIGNHDSLNPDYLYHFNNPNATGYGKTQAGGDYYYTYGAGLFIVLNTNNYNVAEHEKAIEEAVASAPDATWRIVTIHQDIYGSGLDHSDTDGMILRTQLTPIFDRYNVDVVLQGHDHTYSRSKLLYGDGQSHSSYEFRLNAEGSDYDWDHAYDIGRSAQIPLAPAEGDAAGAASLSSFQQDNLCYTIESTSGNTVVNPAGTLYMTANSASGSKYYELISAQQNYIAVRSQNWLPSYSVISMTSDAFSIDTYQITDAGTAEPIDQAFTIRKTADASFTVDGARKSAATALVNGQTYYRLRDLAGALSGSGKAFDVIWDGAVRISSGKNYTGAVLSPAVSVSAQDAALALTVDGKVRSTDAALVNGNYYVPASFLSAVGASVSVGASGVTVTTK